MLTTVRKTFTWSRLALIFFALSYSALSSALSLTSFVAGLKAFGFANDPNCKDMSCAFFSWAYFMCLSLVAFVISITTALVSLNTIRLPERKRLVSSSDGVGPERLSLYVLRAVLFTLVLYGVAIYIGWNAPGTNATLGVAKASLPKVKSSPASGIFLKDLSGNGWAATRAAAGLLHFTRYSPRDNSRAGRILVKLTFNSFVGVLLAGLAAGLARPALPKSSLKPITPGTIDPDLPVISRA